MSMKKVPLRKKTVVGVKSKKVVKSKAAVKKAPTKKTVAKKAPVKKTAAKKAAAKKAPVKKTAAKKAPVKKTAAKKAAVKKAPVKKTAAKKAPVKKTAAKKAAAKKAPAKKTAAKKARAKKVQTKKATTKKIVAQKALPPTLSVAKQLTKGDIAKFQKMLFVERDRLTATINNIEEASRTESGRDNGADLASFAETGTDSFNIETALNIASSESQRLRDVIDALDRIECGTYGICEGSGKPIPKKRLEAFPSARYCVEYQEALEKEAALSEFR